MDRIILNRFVRRMSLRQLQVFAAVSRLKSFTRAAEALHLSQPTVSMQIKKLEMDMGLSLTEQVGKRLSLTEAGEALQLAALDILDTLNRLEMQLNDLKGMRSGHLHLAVVTTANYFAPTLLGKFRRAYPGIKVVLDVSNREGILERMNRNLDDLYLIGKPPVSNEFEFEPYLANPMVIVAPVDHTLAGRTSIPLYTIAEEPFITREQGSGTRVALERRFSENNLVLNIDMELGNNESIKQGVAGGLGIAMLSVHTLTDCDMQALTILDVEKFPVSWRWYIGYPRGKKPSLITKTFIEFMYQQGSSLMPENEKLLSFLR